jgi:hypothetical protein
MNHAQLWGLTTRSPDAITIAWTHTCTLTAILRLLQEVDPEAELLQARAVGQHPGATMRRRQTAQIQFSSMLCLPDFLAALTSWGGPGDKPQVLLNKGRERVVTTSQERLAVEEVHFAKEGADVNNLCPSCFTPDRDRGPLPLPSTERTGKITFWCTHCHTVVAKPLTAPNPPCPIPPRTWEQCRRIPAGTAPVLTVPITLAELQIYLQQLPRRKQPCPDGVPYEILANAPGPNQDNSNGVYFNESTGLSVPPLGLYEVGGATVRIFPHQYPSLGCL